MPTHTLSNKLSSGDLVTYEKAAPFAWNCACMLYL
jgi:hypothetical protein